MDMYFVDMQRTPHIVLCIQHFSKKKPYLSFTYRAGKRGEHNAFVPLAGCPERPTKEMAETDLARYADLNGLMESIEENRWVMVKRHLASPPIRKSLDFGFAILIALCLLEFLFRLFLPSWSLVDDTYQIFYLLPFIFFYRVASLPLPAFRILRASLLLVSFLILFQAIFSFLCF